MGTSNPNKGSGGKTPLIPSWLEDTGSTSAGASGGTPNAEEAEATEASAAGATTPQTLPPIPRVGKKNRFSAPRSSFTSFAKSGGTNRAKLGRAVSGYVTRTAGGAGNAARAMGSSRKAGARLVTFLSDVSSRGVEEALRSLNLEELAGRSIEDIFLGLADYVCPEGGTLDAGIAREAFIQTISDLAANGITDLGALNIDQLQTVFELFATHAIEARLYNAIGINGISLPPDVSAAAAIQQQLRDFVRNGVSDALTQSRADLERLTPDQALRFVDTVYERAFTIMVALGSKEE